MRNKVSIGEYLAFLSTKHEIDPDKLFRALTSAEEHQEATCGELSVLNRGKNKNNTIILISKDSKVIAQFPVSEKFLLEQNNPIRPFMGTRFASRWATKRSRNPSSLQIRDLRKGMKQINLKAKVLEIPAPKPVYTRFGNYAAVSNAVITDETGTIKLCLWNDQISTVSTGDTIQIENASMSTFRGENQLRIGRNGKITSSQHPNPQQLEVHSA
jgi:replication factor A1